MKSAFALLGALLPAIALAQSPFDGTWVTSMNSVKIVGKPDKYLLADGMFTCDACVPQLKIKADGTEQKVTGHDYYDSASLRVVNDHSVELATQRAGKTVGKRTMTVSADGKTLTDEFQQFDGPAPTGGKFTYTRVSAGPAGAHAISGTWAPDASNSSVSADLLTVTVEATADGLKLRTPTGQSYDARFDGKQYPIAGDPGKTLVSLRRIDEHTIEETDSRGGKVTDVITFKVSPDGKTLHTRDEDKAHGVTMTYTAEKKKG